MSVEPAALVLKCLAAMDGNSCALLSNDGEDDRATKCDGTHRSLGYLGIRQPSGAVEDAASNAIQAIPLFPQVA